MKCSSLPVVSVVIPVRNGASTLAAQLEALSGQTCDEEFEVVVADNGSTDGTVDVAKSFEGRLPCLRVVHECRAAGINVARNAGVSAAVGTLIVICDADDEVQAGWLQAHVDGLARFDVTGGPLDHAKLNPPEVATFNVADRSSHPIAGRFLPYASGGNIGFRKTVWEALGGFDESWVRGATEIEFCWRSQLSGFDIGWAPDAVLAYRHGDSRMSEVRRRYRAARANPRLYAQFRTAGMPGNSTIAAIRAWLWLVYRAPWALFDDAWRNKWLQVAAWRSGLVAGSIRYRVWYL